VLVDVITCAGGGKNGPNGPPADPMLMVLSC